jgi:hypothetical protein
VFSFLAFKVKRKRFQPRGKFKTKYFQPTKRFTKNSQLAFDFILQPMAELRDEPWLKISYLWLCEGLGP